MLIKALSVRQPWAWLISKNYKLIENRSWKYNPRFRGKLAIHAAKGCTKTEYQDAVDFVNDMGIAVPPLVELPKGGIVATCSMVGITRECEDPWFFGPLGLILQNVKETDFIPYKGRLGFFDVTIPGKI